MTLSEKIAETIAELDLPLTPTQAYELETRFYEVATWHAERTARCVDDLIAVLSA